ncbi:MAG: hypothetical protein Q9171_000463 [Xanthocarpia ochracea]
MLFLSASLTSLLIFSVSAVPRKPGPQNPQDLTPRKPQDLQDQAASRTPDKCGPLIQNPPTDPTDTCKSSPLVGTKPSPFGILGVPAQNTAVAPFASKWTSCDAAVIPICQKMAAKDTTAGAWYFETGFLPAPSESDSGAACQIGFWLPRDDTNSQNSIPDAAPKPSEEQCQSILNATIDAQSESLPPWSGASINLVHPPTNVPGQWEEPSGDEKVYTGAQASLGYPSYIITNYPTRIPPGDCIDVGGWQCTCGATGKTCAPSCYYDDGLRCECAEDGESCREKNGGSAGDLSCLDEEGTLVECPE